MLSTFRVLSSMLDVVAILPDSNVASVSSVVTSSWKTYPSTVSEAAPKVNFSTTIISSVVAGRALGDAVQASSVVVDHVSFTTTVLSL